MGFVCTILVVIVCFQTKAKESQPRFSEKEELVGQLTVLPDKLKIDGDKLQLEGTFSTSNKMKRKVSAFYKLNSEQEKRQWQKVHQTAVIALAGTFETPVGQTNLNGFNYQSYLKEKGIYQILSINTIHKIEEEAPKFYDLFSWLSHARKRAMDYCDETFLKETALYLKTLIFGFKASEFSEKEEVLANLGILHLFSLSGMHVTFFIGSFRYLFLRAGVTIERLFWLQLLFSVVYAGFTGFSLSVIRALLQSMITRSNREFNWRLSGLDCWSLTLLISLIFQPYLLFSVGGQLSYGLSFFILYVQPIAAKIRNRYIRMYCFSFLLNLMTIPLIGLTFFEWQVTGSLFTFLLLPVFERLILPVLSISLLSSLVWKSNILVTGLDYYFLIQQSFFEWLSRYSTFTLVMGASSILLFLTIGGFFLLLLQTMYTRSKQRFLIAVVLCVLVNAKYFSLNGTVAFIDVGQGDSIFIQAPFHQENILIDTGGKLNFEKEQWAVRAKQKSNADFTVIPYLKSKGVKSLDKVLISHGDADHCGDLLALHKKIPIRALYFPVGTEKKGAFQRMITQLKKSGTKCYPVLSGTTINGVISLTILAPNSPGAGENKDSMVVYTKIAGHRFLFTGDLEKEGERQLMTQYPSLQVDSLKVGHHGSKTSSDLSFLQHIHATNAIISCGRENRFRHPHQETLTSLEQAKTTTFQTDKTGMIYYEWTPFSKLTLPKTIIKEN